MRTSEFLDAVRNKSVVAVLDSQDHADIFRELGFEHIAQFDDFDFQNNQKPLLVVISQYSSQYRINKGLWDTSGGIFTHLAVSKFDPAPETLRYTLQKILQIPDYQAMLDYRDLLYDKALSAKEIRVYTGDGNILTGILSDEVEVANYDSELESGWIYSLAEFFETSIVNVEANKSSFCLDGRFAFTSITHLENSPELKSATTPLTSRMTELAQQGNNWLECKDNNITKIIMGGEDFTETLTNSVKGSRREMTLTEFAFGVVEHTKPLDWKINSVVNEGIRGVHVGIGMGLDTPHVDFIAAGARLEFVDKDDDSV